MPGALKITATSYRGKVAGEYIAPIVLSGKMINKDLVRPLLNVKNKMAVPAVELNGVIKPYTDAPVDNYVNVVMPIRI